MRYKLPIPNGFVIDRDKNRTDLSPWSGISLLKCAWAGIVSTRCYLQHIICEI
jgi:hypothetical protein